MSDAPADRLLADLPATGRGLFLTRQDPGLARRLEAARPGFTWTVLDKNDARGKGPAWLLGRFRERRWDAVVVDDPTVEGRRRRDLYRFLLLLARARRRYAVEDGRTVRVVTRAGDGPRLLGAGMLEAAYALRALAEGVRLLLGLRPRPPRPIPPVRHLAYLRTDFWFGVKAGGSVSHIGGFLGAAVGTGRAVTVVASDPLGALPEGARQVVVPPADRPRFLEEAALVLFNRRFAGGAVRALRDDPPDVIVHRHAVFSVAGALVARALDRPLVLEVNSSEVWVRRNWGRLHWGWLAERLERRAFALADRITVVSEVLRGQLVALGADDARIVVNPNGVEPERFDPSDRGEELRARLGFGPDDVVVGFLGTFTRWHGVLFLAEQVAPLRAADPRLRFLFLGDGDLRAAVEERVTADGAADGCVFAGLLAPDRIPAHLAACDVLVSPHLPFADGSAFFGSPTKLFEYLAAGRAVVGSRLGQIGDLLVDGENGLLHEPGDAAGFREAVLRLAGDADLRRRLGEAARRTVERDHTWEENLRRAVGDPAPRQAL